MTTLTTPALITFLRLREGFRKHAYDDAKPDVELKADTEIEGTLTVGYGTTEYPDGRKVKWDDKVTMSEAVDYLEHYIRETIEPALENLIHRPLAGCQYDAIGSCIYQYGEPEVAGWKLIRLVNGNADWRQIVTEWISGTVMWRGEPLFWARRLSEVFMFLGLDWRAGKNVPPLSDVEYAVEAMGFDGQMPDPEPIKASILFEEEEEDAPITDPTPETPLTTSDLNVMQAESLKTGRKMSFEPVMPVGTKDLSINTKMAADVPYGIDPEAGLQPKEEARRVIHYVKKEKGVEMKKVGEGLTVATGIVASANVASEEVRTFFGSLGHIGYTILFLGLGLGAVYWGVGFIREKWNARKEVEAEIDATQGLY